MDFMKIRIPALSLSLIGVSALLNGCGGGNTSGGASNVVDDNGSVYVSGNVDNGELTIHVEDELLHVAESEGFSVRVRSSSGQPLPNVPVACDTEKGLALLEPTTGFEATDDNGQVSMRLGCETPGSYRMACRVQARRVFKTIKCQGPVPAGFTGFAGAGGGGLGGGQGQGGSVAGTGNVLLTAVAISDNGTISSATSEASIDNNAGICDSATDVEPFFDTYATFKVKNTTSTNVTISSVQYVVDGGDADGGDFTSDSISVGAVIAPNEEATISSVIFKAVIDARGNATNDKYFRGADSPMSSTGITNVTFVLTGTDELGEQVLIRASTALSIGNFNRC